jgi:hypothetical protein
MGAVIKWKELNYWPPEACAAAFAASFACSAAASLLRVSAQATRKMTKETQLLFASLQRRQVGTILTLAFHRRLNPKKITNSVHEIENGKFIKFIFELNRAVTHRILCLIFGSSQIALVSSGHYAAQGVRSLQMQRR